MTPGPVSRRNLLAAAGVAAGTLLAGELLTGRPAAETAFPSLLRSTAGLALAGAQDSEYVPDGTAGLAAAFPLAAVKLLDSPFRRNQARNTSYLLFVDPDRLLRGFRANYGLQSSAQPCGGWEMPRSEVRGHTTGHLMSALALTYANTANEAAAEKGRYIVDQLARCQARALAAGFHEGYLSAFPESFFDLLEAGRPVWSPYYMIHKYLAGLIDQYELAGNGCALEVAARLGDWVCWRTGRLPYARMQQILEVECGGIAEALANLYRITGEDRYLRAAGRFYHARVLDPLAAGEDQLAGLHANMTVPKIVASVRMWEETGSRRYLDNGENFWRIVTGHHSYIIGGSSNFEHWHEPDVIAGQLSNLTCENCVSYNMLKLTRLLHFHQLPRVDMIDYYERTLFNQLLGEQDPTSAHGFNCYYTGLSAGAFKRQPLNYFPGGDPGIYATDWDTFTCDTASGLETQAKFADSIYTRDADGLYVNLFIPSQVRIGGLVLRQLTGFPDEPVTRLSVVSGTAMMTLRVRVPHWVAGPPVIRLNHTMLPGSGPGPAFLSSSVGGWITIRRWWRPGDLLEVTLPMQLAFEPTPDHPSVQAALYGPVVLSGVSATDPGDLTPTLDIASVRRTATTPMTFEATSPTAKGKPLKLIPVSRAAHAYYTVYWQTA